MIKQELEAVVTYAKEILAYHGENLCDLCLKDNSIERISVALVALVGQYEQEVRDRKVQDKLDANIRRDNAAYWDDLLEIKEAMIERLKRQQQQLAEMAGEWQQWVRNWATREPLGRAETLEECARALLSALEKGA